MHWGRFEAAGEIARDGGRSWTAGGGFARPPQTQVESGTSCRRRREGRATTASSTPSLPRKSGR
eukprot:7944775-Pyramimonas_sp.AAC.1